MAFQPPKFDICPFCGNNEIHFKTWRTHGIQYASVQCSQCKAYIPFCLGDARKWIEDTARIYCIRKWNDRT